MDFSKISNMVTSKIGRTILYGRKYSPEILMVAGCVLVPAAVVLSIVATKRVGRVTASAKELTILAKENLVTSERRVARCEEDAASVQLSEEQANSMYDQCLAELSQYRKEYILSELEYFRSVAAVYLPTVVVTLAAMACVVGPYVILKRRNVALIAAYKIVDESFKRYRERVISEYGSEKDRQYRYGLTEESTTVSTTDKNGKTVLTEEKSLAPILGYQPSMYSKLFDECNPNWTNDASYNRYFLHCQQNVLNQKLATDGHLFLNQVYEALGFGHTSPGAVVGWIYKSEVGDQCVDFGMFDFNDVAYGVAERKAAFINGYEKSILLDFNVDGVIYDKI